MRHYAGNLLKMEVPVFWPAFSHISFTYKPHKRSKAVSKNSLGRLTAYQKPLKEKCQNQKTQD
jgi:hypothetical protein